MIGNHIGGPIGALVVDQNSIYASLEVTLDDATLVSTGAVAVTGEVTASLDDATLAATGTGELSGQVAAVLQDAALSATGKLDITGQEAGQLDDAALLATSELALAGEVTALLQDATLEAAANSELSGIVTATLDDATLFADSTLRLPQTGAWAPPARSKPKKKSRQEQERLLDLALAKAFEPKRGPKRPKPEPWLAEPIIVPDALPVPEFNPRLAGLTDYVADLQRQLAQRKFELSQIDADDELLLLSL